MAPAFFIRGQRTMPEDKTIAKEADKTEDKEAVAAPAPVARNTNKFPRRLLQVETAIATWHHQVEFGVTKEEIRAIIHVVGIYCGVPQALECFRAAKKVLEEHEG